jgi:aspartate-semialdehyde dehydrogenase
MGGNSAQGRVVAIVGATGAVGEVLLQTLEERAFPVRRLLPLASERSAGTTVNFRGEAVPVRLAEPAAFEGADFVFFAATGSLSKDLAPEAVKRGAVVIDKSSTWRLRDEVPLVIPEVNADALDKHRGIVSCPNCTTIGFVMALEPIRRAAGLRSVVVTTLQAVSGAGRPGVDELEKQVTAQAEGRPLVAETFAAPIAYNVVPLCETFRDDGYSTEEVKLLYETRKIMSLPELDVTMTCVRVPVPVGHAASILIETERPLEPEAARQALASFPTTFVRGRPPTRSRSPRHSSRGPKTCHTPRASWKPEVLRPTNFVMGTVCYPPSSLQRLARYAHRQGEADVRADPLRGRGTDRDDHSEPAGPAECVDRSHGSRGSTRGR